MSAAYIEIRRLTQADAVLYRDIRLEALRANPEAFGSTFETENAQPLSSFSTTLGNSSVLGAFRDSKLVAIAGFAVQQGQKMAHKGVIWGMYVQPSARRGRIGRQLVEAILDLARQRVELIQGFLEYGTEKNALKQNGRYYDEILMAKDISEKSN
jgi:GNAT superfamily N-acetyltransferase